MAELTPYAHHFEPEHGWMNDPNGLCYFQGKYHAFYQHNPHAAQWGPMHWGHAVSDDLLHWQEQPIALYPDAPYEDDGGCFSGSALEHDGTLYLMYTSVSKELGQAQSIATTTDGAHFEKYAGNPVLPQNPADPESRDFRDPKIFRYGEEFRMVCGAAVNGAAAVLLFGSADLLHWEYLGKIFESRDHGAVPECPDFFPLGDKWVLMFSRMDDTHLPLFAVGDFDGVHFHVDSLQEPEQGTDFYAPQTFLDAHGNRIMIGWLYSWQRTVPQGAVRAGALSLPRVLTLEGGIVKTRPLPTARHLLASDDPAIVREGDTVLLKDGDRVLLTIPAAEAADLQILADGNARELFWGNGAHAFSCILQGEMEK